MREESEKNEEADGEERQRKKGRLPTPVAFDFREESEGRRHRPANRPGVPTRKTTPVVCSTAESPSHPIAHVLSRYGYRGEYAADDDDGGGGCDGGPRYFKGRQDFHTQREMLGFNRVRDERRFALPLAFLAPSSLHLVWHPAPHNESAGGISNVDAMHGGWQAGGDIQERSYLRIVKRHAAAGVIFSLRLNPGEAKQQWNRLTVRISFIPEKIQLCIQNWYSM